jgi:hypothetical protein
MTPKPANATTDAPKRKGGKAVASAAHIQDIAMLNVDESPVTGKLKSSGNSQFQVASEERKATVWLDEMVHRSQLVMFTGTVKLTPVLARVLLSRNPGNRKVSDSYVESYARDIETGSWSFNGEPIIVSKEGWLNDGQHRCEAVIMANKSIDVVFVVGAERDSRLTLDQGRNRMAADYLSMNGHHDATTLAAAAGFVWQYLRAGQVSRHWKYRPTKGEILAFVDETPTVIASLSAIPRKGSDTAGGRSTLAFCHWAIAQRANFADASTFTDSLVVGAGLLVRDPILYARNRLAAERSRLSPNQKSEMIFRAWNAHRRRETPKTLPILDGALPVLER